jgi:glutamate/tyrosine decarboxylase-like PLP-dependent enzyme
MLSGMGMDNIRMIPTIKNTGAMNLDLLDAAIAEDVAAGRTPFFVNSVTGTTVMGGFDNQNDVSEICQKYKVWHHIDACWGGFLTFSDKHKHLFDGADKCDSIAFNPHKGLGVP